MPVPIKLSDLPIGAQAIVRDFPKAGSAFLRLREMGLIVGTPVKLVRCAPLGDPLEIQVRGYHLTLRRSEAEHVMVESA
ncbi:MAG: FeoA family protein [Opitutaceae bacterium]|jgi:ferrous iron transport protein A